jgi:hypothetical protein
MLWQRNLLSLYGGGIIAHQNCASPVIEGGRSSST